MDKTSGVVEIRMVRTSDESIGRMDVVAVETADTTHSVVIDVDS